MLLIRTRGLGVALRRIKCALNLRVRFKMVQPLDLHLQADAALYEATWAPLAIASGIDRLL